MPLLPAQCSTAEPIDQPFDDRRLVQPLVPQRATRTTSTPTQVATTTKTRQGGGAAQSATTTTTTTSGRSRAEEPQAQNVVVAHNEATSTKAATSKFTSALAPVGRGQRRVSLRETRPPDYYRSHPVRNHQGATRAASSGIPRPSRPVGRPPRGTSLVRPTTSVSGSGGV